MTASPARQTTASLPAVPEPEGGPNRARLVAAGVAVLLHGGMVTLLLLVPGTPESLAAPEVVPMIVAMAEPVVEETPKPADKPEQAEAATPTPEPTPVAEPPPPEPAPPEPPPPEPAPPEPPPPEPVVEEPPPTPVEPEPPPPQPTAEEPPVPEPALEPLPEPPPEPPPQPTPPPPPPVPTPRPRQMPRAAPPRPVTAAPAVAPPAPAPAPAARAAAPPPSYLRAVAAALERQKRYPESARARRATGVALLRFTVLRDGRIGGWRIERSAGEADLDQAVAAMIQRARLPAMPADMPGDSLVITVPVRFHLQ